MRRLGLALTITTFAAAPAAAAAKYINPFTSPNWAPARTDMGVDWIPLKPTPVLAIGNALILGSENNAGWPGRHIIFYQLLDGSHAGDVVYVAEHLKRMVATGTTVQAGQRIATALPGYPWTEWGWADPDGSPRAYPCYHEGNQTNSGKEMARFMESLGASVYDAPGKGPNAPAGKLC